VTVPLRPQRPPQPPLRLLSWNVWKLLGDPLAVHRVIRAAEPDLVCLQEGPARWWSGPQLAALARSTGLRVLAGGRSGAGNVLLGSPRLAVTAATAVRFRPADRWIQRRGAALATVALPGEPPIRVAGVHLSLNPAERLAHLADLIARLQASGLPMVVAGDLNEPPGGPSWQALAAIVTDPTDPADPSGAHPRHGAHIVQKNPAGATLFPAPTYPARNPRRRIDAVLTSPGIEVLDYGRWTPSPRDAALASDHIPVLAQLHPPPRH
jgi:endonuclease/exonuclease/phosphatase family metal-dependent hydrolase